MAKKAAARGPDLVRAIVDALRGERSPIGEATPIDAAGIRAAEDAVGVALCPSLAALFQLDVGWMRRAYGWFDAEGRLLARPLAELVADHAGAMAEGFEPILERFGGRALPLDAGSDSARFLYFGDPDELGEYPVIGIDHDDLPELDVATSGFDTWLAGQLGVSMASEKASLEAAHKRLFGRKRGWSIDDPGRLSPPVAGPAPGSIVHAALEAPAKKTGKPRKLTDKQLDKALAERAGDGGLARLGELLVDAAARQRPQAVLDAALVEAAKGGHVATLRAMIAAGASPDAREYYGQALSRAVAYGVPLEIVTTLLEAGASADAASVNGRTALFEAVEKRDTTLARVLLDAGASVDHPESNRMRPLHYAASAGDVEAATLLLDRGADPNGVDHFRTPLVLAVERGQDEMVALLLTRGADPNRGSEYLDQRPLHVAFEHGRGAIAAQLVKAGADRSARDGRGLGVEEVFGANGDDVRPLVLPAEPVSGTLRCRVRVCVFNATGLSSMSIPVLVWRQWCELVAQGLGGPDASLTLVQSTAFAPAPGVHEIEATFEASAVEPVVFELLAHLLDAPRVSVRVAGIWIVPEGPVREGAEARAHLALRTPIAHRPTPFPVTLAPGTPALVFALRDAIPAPKFGDSPAARVAAAGTAFALSYPLWGPGQTLPPMVAPDFGVPPDRLVSELEVRLLAYADGKQVRRLPWRGEAMRSALEAVSLRVHADLPLTGVTLRGAS